MRAAGLVGGGYGLTKHSKCTLCGMAGLSQLAQ